MIFEEDMISPDFCCHSGGANGSDTVWENEMIEIGGKVKAYSYKTNYHNSPNKIEISEEDYQEGIKKIQQANKYLKRNVSSYMNLLARNWCQVKYSKEVFAIGYIVEPGEMGSRYCNKSKYQEVDGGTGYCVKMSILQGLPVYVFDQNSNEWFKWSYVISKYIKCEELPMISYSDFAGVGTRNISDRGINEIKKVLANSI